MIALSRGCRSGSVIATRVEGGDEFEGRGGVAEEVFQVFGAGVFRG
jgi:hypothetical protein